MLDKILDFFSTAETRIVKALKDKTVRPEDTLEYYENLDPTLLLSDADRHQINLWMEATENSPVDASGYQLSNKDIKQIEHWMKVSENLPVDFVPEKSILDRAEDVWNGYCETKYSRY